MKFTPLPQQKLMIEHMLSRPESAVFADPGLGKTAAVLYVISTLLTDFEIKGALIVAPLRVATLTWPEEIAKYEDFDWLTVADLRQESGKMAWEWKTANIWLINYDQLDSFANSGWGMKGRKEIPVDMVVWDEIQRAKAVGSKRIRAIKPYREFFKRHVGLTGTPAPNSYLDLFAPIRLLDGGKRLGTAIEPFKRRYFDRGYNGWGWTIKGNWAKKAIEEKIADMTLTQRKAEWMHLPPTAVEDVLIYLSDEVKKQYKTLQKELLLQIKDSEIVALNAAVLVNKLLQFCSGAIYDEMKVPTLIHDEKIKALQKLVKRINAPVLVAAHYKHEYGRILESIPGAEMFKEDRLPAWNKGEIPCWIAHPRSVGVGLNLQQGSADIIWMSPTYSSMDYDQMNARLIRTGQTKPTTIWRLLVPRTADDAVIEALRVKGEGQDGLMNSLKNLERLHSAVGERV